MMIMKMKNEYYYDVRCIGYLYKENSNKSNNTGEIIIYKGYYKKDINNDETYIIILNGKIKHMINSINGYCQLSSIIKSELFIEVTNRKCIFVINQKMFIRDGVNCSLLIMYAKRLAKFKKNIFIIR